MHGGEVEDSGSWSVPVIRLRRAMASVPMCSGMLAAALSGHPFHLRYVNVYAPMRAEGRFLHMSDSALRSRKRRDCVPVGWS
jgi:hypothetical protein